MPLLAGPAALQFPIGIGLGIATALKVYPALSLLGLIATKRYREAANGMLVAAGLTAATTVLISL
jgi:hypothetical protein